MDNIQKDKELLNKIFGWFCDELNKIYLQYIHTHNLHTEQFIPHLPFNSDMCHNIDNVLQINYIEDNAILRINFQSRLLTLRAKCLYNHTTKKSYINLIDFQLNKIQMRGGGFGTKLLNLLFESQKIWIKEKYNVITPTKMLIFQYYSLPFQLKNDFQFKQLVNMLDPDINYWNITYKFFKLMILMNSVQNLNQYVDNFDMFSFEESHINDLLKRWLIAYYNTNYHNNLWIRSRLLDGFGSKVCDDLDVNTNNENYYNNMIYANIINQLTNDKIVHEYGILHLMQELFILEKTVKGELNV